MKKVYVTSGVGRSGKDTFCEFVGKYIPTYKYSIVDLPKEAAKVLGWDGGKSEKDRRFLSDIMDLSTKYNDAPFKDVLSLVTDFNINKDFAEYEVLIIDMRDPKDIARAVREFGAETILIENPNVKKIESNHADRDVENYKYDYVIKNNGSLEQLDYVAKEFVEYVIKGDGTTSNPGYYVYDSGTEKGCITIECNKMLR